MRTLGLVGGLLLTGLLGCGQESVPPPAGTVDGGTAVDDTTSDAPAPDGTAPDGTAGATGGAGVPGGPVDGASLLVVGVLPPDTLNVRVEAGTDSDVLVELPPDAYGVSATGRSTTLADGSRWLEVRVDDQSGWANARFLAVSGRRSDVPLFLLGGDLVRGDAEAARSLRDRVTEWGVENFPDVDRTVRWNYPVGDIADDHLVVDLLDDGSDVEAGRRLEVFYALSNNDGSYDVSHVVETTLCRSAVDIDGSCV